MNKIKAILGIMIACFVIIPCEAKGAILPDAASIVPAETFILAETAEVNQIKSRVENLLLYKLYKDPAMRPFFESIADKMEQKAGGREGWLSELWKMFDSNDLPEGRMALAIVFREGGKKEEPYFLTISQWGSKIEAIRTKTEKNINEAIEKGAHRSIEEFRDVNIITVRSLSEAQADKSGKKQAAEKSVFCFIDDIILFSDDEEPVKFAAAHIQGAAGLTLADDPDYASVVVETGPERDISLYVNLKHLIKKVITEDKTGQTKTELANLGVDNVTGLGCSLSVGREGTARGKAFLKTRGTRKGILKMLETRKESIRPARFIPASAYSLSFLNINLRRAFDELMSIIYSFDPAEAMEMQQPMLEAGPGGTPEITLRKDIIEYLGSEVIITQSINKPFESSPTPTETMVAIAITDRNTLEKSLSIVHRNLIAPMNQQPARELLGHTIYSVGPVGLPTLGGAAPLQSSGPVAAAGRAAMAFTVTDTHLILGQEPAVERAIRTLKGESSTSIGSKDWFNDVKSAAPSSAGLTSFENMKASGELLWWMLKKSSKFHRPDFTTGPAAAVFAGPGLLKAGDFGLLPEFDIVRKYFGYMVYYGDTRSDGFVIEFRYVNSRKD